MFDIGWSELVLIGVVALIVIGPKELPGVLRMVGQWMAKIRRMAAEFQGQFNEALREAEMADLKKQVGDINETARSLAHFDPLADHSGKPAAIAGAGESAPVDASSQPFSPAVNHAATAPPVEPLLPPPPAAQGAGDTAPTTQSACLEATSPVAPANAGALTTEPRPTP